MDLLAETRKINQLIQQAGGEPVDFDHIARVLSSSLAANTFVVSRKGKILGYRLMEDSDWEFQLSELAEEGFFPEGYNRWLMDIDETRTFGGEGDSMPAQARDLFPDALMTVVPINSNNRLGTLLLFRDREPFSEEDYILAEYGATVVAMEILRSRSSRIEQEARKKAEVQVALNTLSYSELEAIEHILAELEGEEEGILVASDIADRIGITRSVFVNALRKFESAGVIESRSLGMKGTHIRILNEKVYDELERMKA